MKPVRSLGNCSEGIEVRQIVRTVWCRRYLCFEILEFFIFLGSVFFYFLRCFSLRIFYSLRAVYRSEDEQGREYTGVLAGLFSGLLSRPTFRLMARMDGLLGEGAGFRRNWK